MLLDFSKKRRGGARNVSEKASVDNKNTHLLGLLDKIGQYKSRIHSDQSSQKELDLYIEVLGKAYFGDNNPAFEPFELAFEIKKRFLSPESSFKVLLLTGESGSGKSLSCKHLQKSILFEWNNPSEASDERDYLPIFADFSDLRISNSSSSPTAYITISEILKQELQLTESEIKLLQESPLDALLPQFIFIFDDYSQIQQEQIKATSATDYVQNNFCSLIGFETYLENAKIIISCDKETSSQIFNKDLVFGPPNKSSRTLIPDSFLEFVLQPFTDSQISSYLKKYTISCENERRLRERDNQQESYLPSFWSLARKYEDFIDTYHMRELVKVPLNLFVATSIIPGLIKDGDEQVLSEKQEIGDFEIRETGNEEIIMYTKESKELPNNVDAIQSKNSFTNLNRYQCYHLLTNQSINTTLEKILSSRHEQKDEQSAKFLFEKLKQQLQLLALKLSDYTLKAEGESQHQKMEETNMPLLTLCPLLKFNSSKEVEKATFSHRSFQDFFIAQKIIEEIIQKDNSRDLKELLFNQKLLMDGTVSISILKFLVDAKHAQIISSRTLISLIQKSKKYDLKISDNTQRNENQIELELLDAQRATDLSKPQQKQKGQQHPLSVAAANAITILNAAGQKLSNMDLSGVSITRANLTNGIFDQTDFTGADLRGVNFSGASLRGVKFMKANMEGVQFGVIPNLQLNKEAFCIAHSPNGNDLIIGMRGELLVLKKNRDQNQYYREVGKLKGHIGDINCCSFSSDGVYVTTGGEDRTVRLWNFEKGECVKILRGHTSSVIRCQFSQDGKQIISIEKNNIIKRWSISENECTEIAHLHSEGSTDCGFVPNCDRITFLGNHVSGLATHNSTTGRYISTFRDINEESEISGCKFSGDGKEIAIRTSAETLDIVDCIRHHILKSFDDYDEEEDETQDLPLAFSPCNMRVISIKRSCIRSMDIGNGEIADVIQPNSNIKYYSIDPIVKDKIFLLLKDKSTIFLELEAGELSQNFTTSSLHGKNQDGLQLIRANIEDAYGLSEDNIAIFCQKGDYQGFSKENIKELVLNSNPEKITKIELSGRGLDSRSSQMIARSSKWINLIALDLSINHLSDEGGMVIGKNTAWANLEELILNSTGIGEQTIAAISNNFSWKNLKKLQLKSNKLKSLDAELLVMNCTWENLEELDLSQNYIEEAGAVAIGSNNSWKYLQKLDLSSNKVGDKGAEAIAKNSVWTGLKELYLANNEVGDIGAVMIGVNKIWSNLRILSLESNIIRDVGASIIVKNEIWTNLEELYLFNNNISSEFKIEYEGIQDRTKLKWIIWNIVNDKVREYVKNNNAETTNVEVINQGVNDYDAVIIARMNSWANLEVLKLRENKIGGLATLEIGRNTAWDKLRVLSLSQNRIGAEGIAAIGSNRTWFNLEELWMQVNEIGDPGAMAIGKNTAWSKLRILSLGHNKIGDDGAAAIGVNTAWADLQELHLHINEIGDKGAVEIGKNIVWNKLKKLSLSRNKIGDEGTISIGSSTAWINLEELYLNNNKIGNKGAIAIGNSTTWSYLKILSLSGNRIGNEGAWSVESNSIWINLQELGLSDNIVGDRGALAIGKNDSWRSLMKLYLSRNNIGDEGAVAIRLNTTWNCLKEVSLWGNAIGNNGAVEVGKNTAWRELKILSLAHNNIGDEGAISIGSNTTWTALEELYLNDNEIGDGGAVVIGNNNSWSELKKLWLYNNRISDEGAVSVGSNTSWFNLEELYLWENKINNKGGMVIGNNNTWSNLKNLSLYSNRLGDEGAMSIGLNGTWDNLEELYLWGNEIGEKAAEVIGENTTWSKLRILTLSNNHIGDKGAIVLGSNTTWVNLQEIYLRNNKIGDKGAIAIGNNLSWTNLKILSLAANSITDEGAMSIGLNTTWVHLEELYLKGNKIGDHGALIIGNNLSWKEIRVLALSSNNISDKGAMHIASNKSWKKLKTLSLNGNKLTDEGAISISKNITWTVLELLFLYNNDFQQESKIQQAFANSIWKNLKDFIFTINLSLQKVLETCKSQTITEINLCSQGLTDRDAYILYSNLISSLETLVLSINNLGDKGATYIGDQEECKYLKTLDLSFNQIGDDGTKALAKNEIWIHLQELKLSHNQIGNVGAIAIEKSFGFRNIRRLNLSANKIGDEAAVTIGNNVRWKNLEELDLSKNEIGDEGAVSIGLNMTWKRLIKFEIHSNICITEKGKEALVNNPLFGAVVHF